ncbi:MAG: hypothetical protein KDC57_15115 [Saprospiraceae bacterium]|nr:hypothetical protein [Saprospiraceae bacterium]
MDVYTNLLSKVQNYKAILAKTEHYRAAWSGGLKPLLLQTLTEINQRCALNAEISEMDELVNIGLVQFSLGTEASGIAARINNNLQQPLIKSKGSLIYQQLFNGKVLVMIQYPHIEGFGDPRVPKTIAIYRPEEIKEPFIIRHMEEFLQEIIGWEDYDDDEPAKIGYHMSFDADKPKS